MIKANDPKLKSWVPVPKGSDFPIQNLPFGIFKTPGLTPRMCTAIGDHIADLQVLSEHGFFDDLDVPREVFAQPTINNFMALGKIKTRAVRNRISEVLDDDLEDWDASQLADYFLHPQQEVEMLLPVEVGDYTDFYSSREHATNVGTMFRGKDNALMPNWLHLPVGYHGRASSIIVSGTPVRRPMGQQIPNDAEQPVFGPSKLLDFELEMGFVVGKSTKLGSRVDVAQAEEYIFGMMLFNDWSARDIQKWEYVPLGPFLGKSFASTISPWIVTLDALEPFRTAGPKQNPEPLPYLQIEGANTFDIHISMAIQPENGEEKTVCTSNFKYLYWSMAQQLAHHTVNGCNLRVGDIMASGTISGQEESSYGSMLELTWRGTKPIAMPDGSERKFIHDGDTVTMRGYCEQDGLRIGFGKAAGKVLPAQP
ncbi:MAG: fumarylacetoacetase [Phaeodactylibacter xiamenensis]|uniref:fumarylacetoacetase n=1 Tax=Phaeodactylibacter xiamenensis TaxID=1524460 RepID=A0A098S849_9BACT|nr:fumarylacetoacetase [Phaeodactylibacter xiamenensis]KGE88285.1 fumarylacetoacetase [Phaeodactylibacter xiamenensis]MCR9050999.1 fumarylacetoacetase [bacterium]